MLQYITVQYVFVSFLKKMVIKMINVAEIIPLLLMPINIIFPSLLLWYER